MWRKGYGCETIERRRMVITVIDGMSGNIV